MSNRRKRRRPTSHPRAAHAGPGLPVAKVKSPADAVAMIPYVLGFEPHESVVVVSLRGPRRRFGPIIRGDGVDTVHAEARVEYIVQAVAIQDPAAVLVVAFSTRP